MRKVVNRLALRIAAWKSWYFSPKSAMGVFMNDNGVILHVSIFSQASEPGCWRRKESSTNRRCLLHLMHLFPTDSREPFRKVVYCRTLVEMLEQSGNRKARTLKAASPAKFTSVSIDRYTATPVHITNLIGRRLAQMPVSANPRIRRLKSPHCRWEKSASTENSLGNTLARKRPVPVVASVSVPGATLAAANLAPRCQPLAKRCRTTGT
jgi:hypothetical protein